MAKPVKGNAPAKAAGKGGDNKRKRDAAAGAAPAAKKPRADGKPSPKKQKTGADEPKKQLTTKEKRAVIREKKLLHKKNWGVIQEAVNMWEKLRPKETPEQERRDIVASILKKVSGKLLELCSHHTASRVIQFCVKYGTDADRRAIMEQVRANILELSKSKYGHFLVRKLINTAKKEDVPGIVKLFRGHVAQLLRQPYGADVITDLYDVASSADRNAMCAEFYGKEFVLFGGLSGEAGRLHSLKQLMANAPPAKQRAVVLHMTKALTPIMEKALLHPPMTHRLVRDFLECASGLSIEQAVETLSQTGEAVLRMVHTHEGSAAACMVLSYGTPRDRKRLVRAMKGHVGAMAGDEWGHVALCCALAVVDDTALTGKVLVPEIKEVLDQAVHTAPGVRVLLQLLTPGSRRHFPPAILDMLNPPQRTVRGGSGKAVTDLDGEEDDAVDFGAGAAGGQGEDGEDGDDLFAPKSAGSKKDKKQQQGKKRKQQQQEQGTEDGDDGGGGKGAGDGEGEAGAAEGDGEERVLGVSKKDPVQRRRELLGKGPKGLAAALTAAVAGEAAALLRAPHSCELAVEVARGGDNALLFELDPEGVRAVHGALVEAAAADPQQAEEEQQEDETEEGAGPGPSSREHVLLSYYSSRSLRRLVLAAADDGPDSPAASFVRSLWEGALAGRCKQWVGTHCEKVLAAVLHSGVEDVVAAASKELKPLVKQPLQDWAGKLVGPKGGEPEVSGKGKGGKGKAEAGEVKAQGKAGQGGKAAGGAGGKGKGEKGKGGADAGKGGKKARKA